jgi:hypothetical protein
VAHTCDLSYSGGRILVQSQPGLGNLEKPFTKIGLVEWLKVKALRSSPSTSKRKKKNFWRKNLILHLFFFFLWYFE